MGIEFSGRVLAHTEVRMRLAGRLKREQASVGSVWVLRCRESERW